MRDGDGTVAVQDDQIAGPDLGAADHDGHVELAHFALRRSLRPHVARPDREPELCQLVEIADRAVHQHPRNAAHLRLRREQLADERDRRRLGARQRRARRRALAWATAACTIVLSPGTQRAMRAGPATREPGTTWVSSRSTIPVRPAAS